LNPYNKVGWKDHIVDVTGEVIQNGTPLNENNLGHMDDGIQAVTAQTITQDASITQLQVELKALKDASLNNVTSNVFIENFSSLSNIKLSNGIYDPVAWKIYV
jgi:hypothetical protein